MAQYAVIYGAGFIGLLSVIRSVLAIALRAPSLSSASLIEPLHVSPLRASINYRKGA